MTEWTLTNHGKPLAEGDYLCAVFEGGKTRELITSYSKKHGFRYDTMASERGWRTRVYAWAPYIPAPMHIDYWAK